MNQEICIELPPFHDGQRKIVAQAGRFNVVMCGRRFGKTTMIQNIMVEAAIAGKLVGYFAPSYKILDPTWQMMKEKLSPIIRHVDSKYMRIDLVTGGSLEFWSTDGNKQVGRSRKYDLLLFDEAGLEMELGDLWRKALRATLTDRKGTAWVVGSPLGQGEFYRMYLRGQSDSQQWESWESFNASMADNPYIDRQEIEDLRIEYADTPDIFEQEVNGIPIEGSTNPFGMGAISRAIAPMSDLPPVIFGVDLAQRLDWTVIIGIDSNGAVCYYDRFQGRPWPETMETVAAAIGSVPAVVDATGVGRPITDALARKVPNVIPFIFTHPSKQQLMGNLVMHIQQGTTSFPDGEIVKELKMFQCLYGPNGAKYSAPPGMNDDCVCALAMALSERDNHVSGTDILEIV